MRAWVSKLALHKMKKNRVRVMAWEWINATNEVSDKNQILI